ncbi:fumarylacetoacetate hydrolase family protein [Temperatibacter marinus]|uniref:Fumarylacetoacetate hydrolase family protein n=1 Tax=Temperatibacter marinus TaxID=1456591 RepID=A0AA52EDU1_9PROT|nr:fumarylacetoacetate hydrolase family protein [Temperatibacter marinus]WND02880.1 fumarylacetoacetate hydrolase family protein [Temperatibacter marinus]
MSLVKLHTALVKDTPYIGVEDGTHPIVWALGALEDFIDLPAEESVKFIKAHAVSLPKHARPCAIFTPSSRIFCVGKNYAKHAQEMGGKLPSAPDIFLRFQESFVTSNAPLKKPAKSEAYDFEGELAVIIGKKGRAIPEALALQHVFGYSIAMDGTARDWQKRTSQFSLGKNWEQSGSIASFLLLQSKAVTPPSFSLKTELNSEIMQQGTTDDMIFSIPALIATLSEVTTLHPGDILLTGTPDGVGAGRHPQIFLKNGDRLNIIIEKIGTLKNTVSE